MFCTQYKTCPKGAIPYIVREGDTLDKIAAAYLTDTESILKLNVNLNIYNLYPQMTICVPLPDEKYPNCRTTNYYIAQEGDTFYSIGQKFGIDTEEIINANLGVMPENIYTGIILCLPVAAPPVCLSVKTDGSRLSIIQKKDGATTTFDSFLTTKNLLVPKKYILTKKRLESGSTDGAKELLFSPFELGIRGEKEMANSNGVFIEVSDNAMVEIFNSCPVGTVLEVVK